MMEWLIKKWQDLSKEELYAILKFRMEIFMLEQQSFYLDLDEQDQQALHFFAVNKNKIIAYARISTGDSKEIVFIRRVAVHKDYRKMKLGTELMKKISEFIDINYKNWTIELDAQYHLQAFYQGFDFKVAGEPYDDGGVLHIRMIKKYVI